MPDEKTRADAVRLYLTGAGSDGGAQADPDASLGNYRSSTEFQPLGTMGGMEHIALEFVAGKNGVGDGALQSDGSGNIRWTAPGSGAVGAYVAVGDGETKILEDGGDRDKYVRVSRSGTAPPAGTQVISLTDVFANLWDNVSDAEHQAGDNEYRALMFKNETARNVSSLRAWIQTLGTEQTTDTTQLGAAGAGSIATTGDFKDWPDAGFARIVTSAGALREIVYYSSRTDAILTVPAAGRAQLGTAAAAGAATDTAYSVPGIRLGKEAPSAQPSGHITDKTGAGEGSAPAVSWATGISSDDALEIGSLGGGYIYGLWIHRAVMAEVSASALVRQGIAWSFKMVA